MDDKHHLPLRSSQICKINFDISAFKFSYLQKERFKFLMGTRYKEGTNIQKIVVKQYLTFEENYYRALDLIREVTSCTYRVIIDLLGVDQSSHGPCGLAQKRQHKNQSPEKTGKNCERKSWELEEEGARNRRVQEGIRSEAGKREVRKRAREIQLMRNFLNFFEHANCSKSI